jgi:hypothetical protein
VKTLCFESILHLFTDTNIPTWLPGSVNYSAELKGIQAEIAIYIYTHENSLFFIVRRTYLNKGFNFASNTERQRKKIRRRIAEFVLQIRRYTIQLQTDLNK